MAEERRLVTVLFADVVGSTALGESLDPEDVRALLGRLFRIAREAVEQHGADDRGPELTIPCPDLTMPVRI